MIKPTVGRIVHYHPDATDGIVADDQPCAAIVTHVHAPDMVNLVVFDGNGFANSRTSVTLVQPGAEVPSHSYCRWPPRETGQG